MRIVGLDPAGKTDNITGFCVMDDSVTETKQLHTDTDILREIEEVKPDLIAIDAPLWLPKFGPWRPADQLLIKRGFHPVTTMLPSMKMLALRGIHLAQVLRQRGYRIIEVFPRATEKILGISKEPRKNKDEYDALLCALTGKAYLEGRYEDLSGVIIPK